MGGGGPGPRESCATNTAESDYWRGARDANPVQSDFERANRIGARQQWDLSAADARRTGLVAGVVAVPGIDHELRHVHIERQHIFDGWRKCFDDERRTTAWRRGIGRAGESCQPDDERLEPGEYAADATRHHAHWDDLDRRSAAVSEVI